MRDAKKQGIAHLRTSRGSGITCTLFVRPGVWFWDERLLTQSPLGDCKLFLGSRFPFRVCAPVELIPAWRAGSLTERWNILEMSIPPFCCFCSLQPLSPWGPTSSLILLPALHTGLDTLLLLLAFSQALAHSVLWVPLFGSVLIMGSCLCLWTHPLISEFIRAACAVWPYHLWLFPPDFFFQDYCALDDQNSLVTDQAIAFKLHSLLGSLLILLLCVNI